MNEFDKLQEISNFNNYSNGMMAHAIDYCYKIISRNLINGSILELGPAEGLMTERLIKNTSNLTVVEASTFFCQQIEKKHPQINVYNSLFEDFKPIEEYDNIILGHVLEHVLDPQSLLNLVKTWLSPKGIIFASVPNSHSIHRQAAVHMKLLSRENSLNNRDIIHGHRRVFNLLELKELFNNSNFNILKSGGYWLKPVSNSQIEETWNSDMIDAFLVLGEKYPEISAEIYLIATL
jgi:2-polyprenyl-3-methyl-5-hydroxy-6-metoxy-1,4-benzoquinol methylase